LEVLGILFPFYKNIMRIAVLF